MHLALAISHVMPWYLSYSKGKQQKLLYKEETQCISLEFAYKAWNLILYVPFESIIPRISLDDNIQSAIKMKQNTFKLRADNVT